MSGLGLITNPNVGHIIFTVLLILLLIFMMAAGGVAIEWFGRLFKRSNKGSEKKAAPAK